MKKSVLLTALIIGVATLSSCSKDAKLSRKIDGRWIASQFTVDGSSWIDSQVYLDLDKDGAFIFSNDGYLYAGDWSVDDEHLELFYPGGEGVVAYGAVEIYEIVELKKGEIHLEGNIEGDFVIFKGALDK